MTRTGYDFKGEQKISQKTIPLSGYFLKFLALLDSFFPKSINQWFWIF